MWLQIFYLKKCWFHHGYAVLSSWSPSVPCAEWSSSSYRSVLQEWFFFFNIALQDEDISPVIFLPYFSVILFSPLHFFPRRLQYAAVWIVCYYPAGDNIITTYFLSRVCKEWCRLGPQWSNSLTQGSRITHSWLGEVKHYQLESGVNKREVCPTTPLPHHPLVLCGSSPFSSR